MAVSQDSPVTAIQGIGAAHATRLASLAVCGVFDLLRLTASQLHAAFTGVASYDQARSWRAMASLLQVEAVTPQWAEGLVRGGVDSVAELASKDIAEVQDILTKARDEGLVPDVPKASESAIMIRDAAVIQHTGTLTLTVRAPDQRPCVGATASLGRTAATTDERGRVRLIRIPAGPPTPLRIEHPDFRTLLIADPPISWDYLATSVHVLTMDPGTDPVESQPLRLSEYDGDELPVPGNQPTREETLSADELREGDLLVVSRFYESAPDVRLASVLRDYVNGEFLTHQYRVPTALFQSPPRLGEAYVYRNGAFKLSAFTIDRVRHYRIRRRLAKAFSGRPAPTDPADIRKDIQDRLEWLADHGGLSGYVRLRI